MVTKNYVPSGVVGGSQQVDPWAQPVATNERYANEVEVEEGKHDATLRFYRKQALSRSLVKEITIPLGLLKFLKEGK